MCTYIWFFSPLNVEFIYQFGKYYTTHESFVVVVVVVRRRCSRYTLTDNKSEEKEERIWFFFCCFSVHSIFWLLLLVVATIISLRWAYVSRVHAFIYISSLNRSMMIIKGSLLNTISFVNVRMRSPCYVCISTEGSYQFPRCMCVRACVSFILSGIVFLFLIESLSASATYNLRRKM